MKKMLFKAFEAANMNFILKTYIASSSDVIEATRSRIVLRDPSSNKQEYLGAFTFTNGTLDWTRSTLTGFTQYNGSNKAWQISKAQIKGAKYYEYASFNDAESLRDYALRASDQIIGSNFDDILIGGELADHIDGLDGSDRMIGEKGDDTYIVDNNNDIVVESKDEGTDTVRSSVTWILGDHLENLELIGNNAINGTGNNLKNKITGNDFANVLDGGGDQDTLIGGKGSDTYIIDHLQDKIIEVASKTDVDTVLSSVTWTLGANLEHLTLTGTSEINGTGNSAPNTIIGNAAKNLLDGGAGGKDRLTGGEGGDGFTFSSRPTKFLAADADVLTDFSSAQGDKIRLKRTAFGISPKTGSATLTFASTPTELAAELETASMFIYDTSEGHLYWNQNGVGANAGRGGVIAVLENKATLSATDLILF